jgi:hypothetical protein
MTNSIGRALVLVHTLISLFALCLAILVYFEAVDWGRAEPRLSRGEPAKGASNDLRIASEYDKSAVIFKDAETARNLVVPLLAPAEASLREAEARFPQNHLFYVAELKKLREGDEPIEVKAIAANGIPTDTPGKRIGKPIPEVKVEGLDRSLAAYRALLATEQKKLDPVESEIRKYAEADQKITYNLTGKGDDGKKQMHGLYELVDQEFKNQQLLIQERDYLQPQWATAVESARRFGERRTSLEATLRTLQKAKEGSK